MVATEGQEFSSAAAGEVRSSVATAPIFQWSPPIWADSTVAEMVATSAPTPHREAAVMDLALEEAVVAAVRQIQLETFSA
jgi:hypothetical protein